MNLRLQLADAYHKLRAAQRDLELIKARSETEIIDRLVRGDEKALGANAETRARKLTLALAEDYTYNSACADVESLQSRVDMLKAQIGVAEDERRDREIVSKEHYTEVLERAYPVIRTDYSREGRLLNVIGSGAADVGPFPHDWGSVK